MKRKGISIWEQYLERIVLGAAVLFFVGFTVMQVLSDPNSVEQAKIGKVSPGDIDGLLRERAEELQGRLSPEAAPAFEIPDHRPLLDRFDAELVAPISPVATLTPLQRRVVIAGELDAPEGVAYYEPRIAAPFDVVVEQNFGAIEDVEMERHAALAELFPDAPYDVHWITPGALFDLGAVREQFAREGDDGAARIPETWFGEMPDILDVRVEREELVDGNWTNRVTLDPLPGMVTLRDRLEGETDKAGRQQIFAMLDDRVAQEIRLPSFYDTRDAWTPPDPRVGEADVEGLSEEEKAIVKTSKRLRKMVNQRDQQLERLHAMGGKMGEDEGKKEEETKKPERPGSPGSAGGGSGDRRGPPKGKRGAPGGGSGFGLGSSGGSAGGSSRVDRAAIDRLKRAIRNLNGKIGQIEGDLARMRAAAGAADDDADADADANADQMVIWAHDLTVEPGKVYRYRFMVELYNPFFARKLSLLEEQHALAERITLRSEPSAWSAPERAIPDRKVYVTRAHGPLGRNKGQLGLGQATAEVFRFYDGRWWVDTFAVQPGDRVGGEVELRGRGDDADLVAIDFGTDWFVLDIIEDIDADRDAEDRGHGAWVLLQDRNDASRLLPCKPLTTATDEEREWLREAVELAESAADLASAD